MKNILVLIIFIMLMFGLNRIYRWWEQKKDYEHMAEVDVTSAIWDTQAICNSLKTHVKLHDVTVITNVIVHSVCNMKPLISAVVEDSAGKMVVAYFRDTSIWVKGETNIEWGVGKILTVKLKIVDGKEEEGWLTVQLYLNSGIDYDSSEKKQRIVAGWCDSALRLNTNKIENIWKDDEMEKKYEPKGYFVF